VSGGDLSPEFLLLSVESGRVLPSQLNEFPKLVGQSILGWLANDVDSVRSEDVRAKILPRQVTPIVRRARKAGIADAGVSTAVVQVRQNERLRSRGSLHGGIQYRMPMQGLRRLKSWEDEQ
jgi:hypothetical protein